MISSAEKEKPPVTRWISNSKGSQKGINKRGEKSISIVCTYECNICHLFDKFCTVRRRVVFTYSPHTHPLLLPDDRCVSVVVWFCSDVVLQCSFVVV